MEENSNYKVIIELLSQLWQENEKLNLENLELAKEKEKEKERGDIGDKALKALQEKHEAVLAEMGRISEESERAKQDVAQLWQENEKLDSDNIEFSNQAQKYYDAMQARAGMEWELDVYGMKKERKEKRKEERVKGRKEEFKQFSNRK
jgi:chromosome segregation ATPase